MVVFVAVPEEIPTPAEANNQTRLAIVLPSEGITVSDHSSTSSQGISESGVLTSKSLLDVGRHSAVIRCFPASSVMPSDSALSRSSAQNITMSTLHSNAGMLRQFFNAS